MKAIALARKRTRDFIEERYRMWKRGEIDNWLDPYPIVLKIIEELENLSQGSIKIERGGLAYKRLKELGIDVNEIRAEFVRDIIARIPKKKLKMMRVGDLKAYGISKDVFHKLGINLSEFRSRMPSNEVSVRIGEILEGGAYFPMEIYEFLRKDKISVSKKNVRDRLRWLLKNKIIFQAKTPVGGIYSKRKEKLEERLESFRVRDECLPSTHAVIYEEIEKRVPLERKKLIQILEGRDEFSGLSLNAATKYALQVLKRKGLVKSKRRANRVFYMPITNLLEHSRKAGINYLKLRNAAFELHDRGRLDITRLLGHGIKEEECERYMDFILARQEDLWKRFALSNVKVVKREEKGDPVLLAR
jgi:hypothetical protein